jgi:hypothetical protein
VREGRTCCLASVMASDTAGQCYLAKRISARPSLASAGCQFRGRDLIAMMITMESASAPVAVRIWEEWLHLR